MGKSSICRLEQSITCLVCYKELKFTWALFKRGNTDCGKLITSENLFVSNSFCCTIQKILCFKTTQLNGWRNFNYEMAFELISMSNLKYLLWIWCIIHLPDLKRQLLNSLVCCERGGGRVWTKFQKHYFFESFQ